MTKEEIHDLWFRRKWSASSWATSALNLWRAADILYSAYQASTAEDGEPINCEDTELNIPATLLYAYAIENAVKGTLIKKRNLSPGDCKKFPGWHQHDLVVLFNEAKIQTLDDEQKKEYRRLLVILTAQIQWAGKYPSTFELANGNKGFLLAEQWEYESVKTTNMPPSKVNILMREKLEKLFRYLVNEIYKNPHTKPKPAKN
jgi:hypothetical protein